ncbi:MAG TPA: glycosyltransferase [Acidimicrobiales bacterium]|nr:glycosyltransferase [Acidimicrobiales bacterium]
MGPPLLHVVTSDQRRGAEVFAADLVAALAGRGVEQRVVVLQPAAGTTVDFAAPVTRLDAGGRLAAVRGMRSARGSLPGAVTLAHGGEPLRAAVLGGARPVLYRRIGSAPAAITHGPRRHWHRWLMTRAALVLCVADAVREETVRVFGLPPALVRTVPNAVDPDRLAAGTREECRRTLGLAPDAHVVLTLGALSPEKDPLRALRITAPARAAGGVVHLFVGDGPLAGEVAGPGVVVVPGRPDVGTALRAADVLVLCSRTEGMPAVVIEAGLAGLPVVADRVAGVEEVVEDEVTGVLVPPGDDGAAADAVAALLVDGARRAALGAAAAKRCAVLFAIGPVADAYLEAVAEVAARGPRH